MKYHLGDTGVIAKERYDDLFSAPPEYITADVETPSISDVRPLGIGLSTPRGDAFYFPIEDEGIPWHLFNKETDTKVIWYNAPFDLDRNSFGKYLNISDLDKTEDAIIPTRYQGFNSNTLDYVSSDFHCQHKSENMGDVLDRNNVSNKKNFNVLDLAEEVVAKKCLDDVLATMDVWHWLRPRIPEEYYNQELEFLKTLLYMSHTGMKKDNERLGAISRELEADMLRLQGRVDYFGFNPYSANEVCTVLNEGIERPDGTLQVYWLPMTAKGNPITKESMLETIDHPAAQLTILYKKYNKLLGTYVRPWLTEDRIYSRFKMDAATGRTSSENYNLQNIPTGKREGSILPKAGSLRTVFVPDDYWGTKWDLSQIELRVLAWLSGDPEMLRILNSPGGDLHDETERLCHALGYMISRVQAKNCNFGMIYGGSPEILSVFMKVNNLKFIQSIIDAWKARFPVAWAWIERQKKKGLRDLTVYTAFGRKLNIGTSQKGTDSIKHIENCSVNWPIQGTAAEIFKRISNAMTDNLIPRKEHRSQIHDEFWENGAWYIPDWFERIIPGLWTPIEWSFVRNYGE